MINLGNYYFLLSSRFFFVLLVLNASPTLPFIFNIVFYLIPLKKIFGDESHLPERQCIVEN